MSKYGGFVNIFPENILFGGRQIVLCYNKSIDKGGHVMLFETCYYVVEIIDGDYAHLRKLEDESEDLKLVARALLPEGILVGSKLKYEMLQYELV